MGRAHQKLTWVVDKISFSFTCGIVFHYKIRYDVLSEENISTLFPPYIMCFKGVAASVFKSLKFLYWVTGLSLTWNFEVLEVCINSYFQCFLRGPAPIPPLRGWEIFVGGNLTRSDFDPLNPQN